MRLLADQSVALRRDAGRLPLRPPPQGPPTLYVFDGGLCDFVEATEADIRAHVARLLAEDDGLPTTLDDIPVWMGA